MSLATMGISPLTGWVIDATGQAYRYTFMIGGGLAFCALCASFYVYRKFHALGGIGHYMAPEP